MITTTAYVLVRTGGQYSDWYHNNLCVFLTKEEGDQFITDTNAKYAKFNPYCFNSNSHYLADFADEWMRLNKIKDPLGGEDWARRYAWARQKELDRLTDLVQSAECELHEFERIKLMANNFSNPYELIDDAEIEEVQIMEGTRLWSILNGPSPNEE